MYRCKSTNCIIRKLKKLNIQPGSVAVPGATEVPVPVLRRDALVRAGAVRVLFDGPGAPRRPRQRPRGPGGRVVGVQLGAQLRTLAARQHRVLAADVSALNHRGNVMICWRESPVACRRDVASTLTLVYRPVGAYCTDYVYRCFMHNYGARPVVNLLCLLQFGLFIFQIRLIASVSCANSWRNIVLTTFFLLTKIITQFF